MSKILSGVVVLMMFGYAWADDFSFSGVYEGREDWAIKLAYFSEDVRLSWYREYEGSQSDYGYDYSQTWKLAFLMGQVKASRKQAKKIDTQELALMAKIRDWGFGLAISTVNLGKPRLLVKVRYAFTWKKFSLTVDWSSNFIDRRQFTAEPRFKVPAWRNLSLGVGGKYQRVNGKEWKQLTIEGVVEIERP